MKYVIGWTIMIVLFTIVLVIVCIMSLWNFKFSKNKDIVRDYTRKNKYIRDVVLFSQRLAGI